MPVLVVLGKEVRDRLVLVSVVVSVLIALCLTMGALWAPLSVQFASMRALLPPGVLALVPGGDMSSITGWVNAQVMTLTAPGALIVVAILSALRGTVGEEDRGTLALLLGSGVSRATFSAAKFGATLVHVLLTGVGLLVGLMAANSIWSLGLADRRILAATGHAVALGWFFGALTIALGLATGRLRMSGMLSVASAATAFVVATFFPLSEKLSGWERISPWYYFSAADPLNEGPDYSYVILLLGVSFILYLLSLWRFARRDLRS
ncbi:MAG: hypothetical protein WA962_03575 [Ornithinimicrobium sp.]